MEKQRWEESEKRTAEERKLEKIKSRGKKMQVREKVAKSRNIDFLQIICGPGGSTSRLAKAAGAKPSGQMRDEQLHAIAAQSKFRLQNA